jgi:hypothetical protein
LIDDVIGERASVVDSAASARPESTRISRVLDGVREALGVVQTATDAMKK